jgi:hypothetical protein
MKATIGGILLAFALLSFLDSLFVQSRKTFLLKDETPMLEVPKVGAYPCTDILWISGLSHFWIDSNVRMYGGIDWTQFYGLYTG